MIKSRRNIIAFYKWSGTRCEALLENMESHVRCGHPCRYNEDRLLDSALFIRITDDTQQRDVMVQRFPEFYYQRYRYRKREAGGV